MEEIFDLFDGDNEDLVRDINETVNHAIDSALLKLMRYGTEKTRKRMLSALEKLER